MREFNPVAVGTNRGQCNDGTHKQGEVVTILCGHKLASVRYNKDIFPTFALR